MQRLTFFVPGVCISQGSKNIYNGRVVESAKGLKPWRNDVALIAKAAKHKQKTDKFEGPVYVETVFVFKRPQKRFDGVTWKATRPDKEKLERAIFDALTTAEIWNDDAQVADSRARKVWTSDEWPNAGVHVVIESLLEQI